VAAAARRVGRQSQRDSDPVEGVVERQRQRALEILSAPRLCRPGSATATTVENAAEEVTEATRVLTEQVTHVDVVLLTAAEATTTATTGSEPAAGEQ
jgi:hypothetical protein